MKIAKLQLYNFRKFADYAFSFHPNFTVIIGDNASGKTSILDALAIMLGSYLLRSGISTGRSGISKDEAKLLITQKEQQIFIEPQKEVFIKAEGSLRDINISWKRNIGDRGKEAGELISMAVADLEKLNRGENVHLPILLYYGTGRLWDIHRKVAVGKPESQTVAYKNCLDPKSDQHLFEKWFKQLELVALQKKQEIPALEAVRDAVKTCIPGAKDFYYDIANDALMVDLKNEGLCLFNNLSDGYRNMLAMVADIAHRAARLNPHFAKDAAKNSSGIVLIDEIDLHLHPKWQRLVIGNLQTAFPNIQFIATTHSPFILQSLKPGELIDLNEIDKETTQIDSETDNAKPAPRYEFSNKTIEDIAEEVMGIEVPQRSYRYQQMYEVAKEYYSLLQNAQGANAEKKKELEEKLDELSAPFSDNIAYHAFLEMERLAAGLSKSKKERED